MAYNQVYGAGEGTLISSLSGWHLKSRTPVDNAGNQNIVRRGTGHYIVGSLKSTGSRTDITEVWEADDDNTGEPTGLKVGKVDAMTNIDSVSLNCTNAGRPTLTIIGHTHNQKAGNDAKHLDGSYTCQFQFPSGAYGAVNPFNGASVGVESYEITGSTQTYTMNHQDENGANGEFLAGISIGVMLTAHMDATTATTVASGVSGDWIINASSNPASNESLRKLSVDGVKYIDESGAA